MTDKNREAFETWLALQKVPEHGPDSAVAATLKVAEIAFYYARKQAIEECVAAAESGLTMTNAQAPENLAYERGITHTVNRIKELK